MDKEKEVNAASGGVNVTEKKRLSQANSEAMEKCLEENKGDNTKCKDKVEAFRSSSSTSSPTKPLRRFIVRSGSLVMFEWNSGYLKLLFIFEMN
ncbi:hypothetical protein ES319_A07G155000v1 [Gossypium barbadense]|nr:hypothetical protein ES319_A07G155000v1 [Gossypium barbadense]TYH10279.1 hypothetical protein ES288_A07G165900v1 [Gossypium darwinii]